MQYSKEVEEMVCVAKGPNHGPAPIPGRRQVGAGEGDQGHLRPDPRYRLVRPSAGRLQTDPERQERRH